ncbi:hypothetical protein COHA_006949 [Chlorella ohadii]|uniref:Uncharacterized protein n=1 Tax=Chlorella ohadii TaxID=2649997 RepID=A0AAD5DN75_9CHLO|nr:hypothetical protein COHA_006949 [Chlorella ohadii]
MQQFEAALRSVAPEARVVEAASSPGSEYRRFAVNDKLFDHDDIDMAAQVKYVWPIQQAVTDFGSQRQRLKEVRRRLGWRLLGCDLLECYEE